MCRVACAGSSKSARSLSRVFLFLSFLSFLPPPPSSSTQYFPPVSTVPGAAEGCSRGKKKETLLR